MILGATCLRTNLQTDFMIAEKVSEFSRSSPPISSIDSLLIESLHDAVLSLLLSSSLPFLAPEVLKLWSADQ